MANMFFLYILFLLAIFNIFVYYLINRNKPLILVVIRISSILAAMILCVLGLPADGEKNKDQIQMAIKVSDCEFMQCVLLEEKIFFLR